jgi:hypothetical protein
MTMGSFHALRAAATPGATLVSVKIWDGAPHNAFTDLIRHRDEWFCVFREGSRTSPDGALQVLVSEGGPGPPPHGSLRRTLTSAMRKSR